MADPPGPLTRSSSRKRPQVRQTALDGGGEGAAGAAGNEAGGVKPAPSAAADGQRSRARRGTACRQCRRMKVVCCGSFPCTRCWRLALPCRPQDLSSSGGGGSAGGSSDGASEEGADEEEDASFGQASALVELAFSRAQPLALAELMAQSFMALHAEGRVVRKKALLMARVLSAYVQLFGSDPGWGLFKLMEEAQHISPVDLEPVESLKLSPPPGHRKAMLQARLPAMAAAQQRAMEEPCFKEQVEAHPGTAFYMGVVTEQGVVQVSNTIFKSWWQLEIWGEVIQRKTLGILLFASLVDPEDRKAWLDAMNLSFFTNEGQQSIIIKAFDAEGTMGLYQVRVIPTRQLPDGTYTAFIASLDRLPPSRHLSLTPGHRAVMQTFKHQRGANATAGAEAGQGPPQRLLPGLACIPTSEPIDAARMAAVAGSTETPMVAAPALTISPAAEVAAWADVGTLEGGVPSLAESELELLEAVFENEEELAQGSNEQHQQEQEEGAWLLDGFMD